ncbi:vacuolar ATP synthase subunit D [Pisolithus microcarpus]|nr:vacuolar ATP synthase subunit D [Pisolithus microcarpus]
MTLTSSKANNGFLAGIVHGCKAGILTQSHCTSLTQCETLEDLKTRLSTTGHGNFPANEALLTTTIIWDWATQLLVDQSGFLHSNAVEPLSKFLDYITSMYSYVINDDVLLIVGILHERDMHELLEWCHPRGVFESTLLSVSLTMLRNCERAYSWRRPLMSFTPGPVLPKLSDLDDLHIEIIRNTIYKAYLEDSYKFVGTL